MRREAAIVRCGRCGKTAPRRFHRGWAVVPDGWEGSIDDAVCPACQYVEWHPCCLAPVDMATGEPWDVAALIAMPREEVDTSQIRYCECIDYTVAVTDDDEAWPQEWRCPRCGYQHTTRFRTFQWVHRDYVPSGLHPGMFTVESAELDDDEPLL